MNARRNLRVVGMPGLASGSVAAVCRSRLLMAVNSLMDETGLDEITLQVETTEGTKASPPPTGKVAGTRGGRQPADHHDDTPIEVRATRYRSSPPLYDFEQLVVPAGVKDDLIAALGVIRVESLVFDDWGLRKIEPFPRTALSFQGPPGTGKTLAAHALARHLGRPILIASYADIESKFHGDGPKNVDAVFFAAGRDGAVLFIDEAESLLSRRLAEASTGSESAINSMRSQLLICLERFKGVVIFATNLVESYDEAFDTRVRHITFPLPDEACRREIWRHHLPPELPLGPDFSIDRLASDGDDLCGRDIKNAVIDAAVRAALDGKTWVDEVDLSNAIARVRRSRVRRNNPKGRKLTPEEKAEAEAKARAALKGDGG